MLIVRKCDAINGNLKENDNKNNEEKKKLIRTVTQCCK